ncbi:E3 ubiquitin-protein ligase SDIR1 isoform X2 [Apium graveolens]|uniref:E3 ubiquitin-protein ligase SDIR1 isoform X2 n=1 Tax=Apium graveolens TaxID=4045 RepID=UPI003D7BB230
MSFVFRGARPDIENGLSGVLPDRRAMRVQPRPINTNSLAFLISVLLLFTILNSQMSPNFLAQAQAHAAAASGLLARTEFRLHMPPSIALTTRGRLQGLRLQLALLDREFDDLDYETLRSLDSNNPPNTHSMSEEEINALPVHKYKVSNSQSDGSAKQKAPSSSSLVQETELDKNSESLDDELTCTICLEQVTAGELVRSLPCLHQFHATCIDQWLHQQGTCPVCKLMVGSGWQESRESETDGDDMV